MNEWTKVELRHRRVQAIRDITDFMALLFPGNRNQQHAASCILLELRETDHLLPDMAYMEGKYQITRRTLQRARAKLNRLGLIERIGFLSKQSNGDAGWRLSGRFTTSLRLLANTWQDWRATDDRTQTKKDQALIELMR